MKRLENRPALAVQVKKLALVKWFATTFGILMLTACFDQSPLLVTNPANETEQTNRSQTEEQEVEFQFDLSAQLTNEAQPASQQARTIKALAPDVMSGTMLIENVDTGESESRPWLIQVDDRPFPNVNSITAAALKPGFYNFTLSVVSGHQQYIGSTLHQVYDNDTVNDIPMLLRPVIGDSTIDVTVVDSLIQFGFSFPPDEINAAGLIDPAITISIDGGVEQFFILNPNTGLSDDLFFVNLAPGQYNIKLALLDSGFLIGKSVIEQELVSVTGGLDVSMDIVPIYGEINFQHFTDVSDTTVDIQVPADVVNEAGGLGNLSAILRIVGNSTPFFEEPLALSQVDSNYIASTTIPQLTYDEITYELRFIDNSRGKDIGFCLATETLNAFGSTVNCPIVLERRSVIAGSFLSKLGVNVFDEEGTPLPGAVVSIDGEPTGITGNSTLATPGYTRINVEPGQRLISAEFGPMVGELLYESIPLNVTSVNIFMGQTADIGFPIFQDDFSGLQTGIAAPMNYWFGCNGDGTPEYSMNNNGSLELLTQFQDPEFDYCYGTSAVTEHSFTDFEIIDAGGFQVSVDIAWSDDPNTGLAIGIGEELTGDNFNFSPIPTIDAMVDVHDNEVIVRIFDNGVMDSINSYTTGVLAADLSNVTLDVQTDSFAPGAAATLMVLVNGTAIPSIDFTWDGGSNHIEVRGGTTTATDPAMVVIDKLTVRPR